MAEKSSGIFANDGNFMAKFLAMQQSQKQTAAKPPPPPPAKKPEANPPANDGSFMSSFLAMERSKEPPLRNDAEPTDSPSQPPPVPTPTVHPEQSAPAPRRGVVKLKIRRRKRPREVEASELTDSRCAPVASTRPPIASSSSSAAAAAIAAAARVSLATKVKSAAESNAEYAKQLEQQQEMQFLEDRIKSMQRARDREQMGGKHDLELLQHKEEETIRALRYTVEEGEEDGPVFSEHRKRAAEMLRTSEKNLAITTQAYEGYAKRTHIGSYIPAEELTKFMNKASAARRGETLKDDEAYAQNRLGGNNVGFQMLQKKGWDEGSGLGKDGSGITAPVSAGSAGGGQQGLGTAKLGEVAQGDDEFDEYRKRMMMAYRFRPNPLNNPRRAYY